MSENTPIPISEEGGPTMVNGCTFASTIRPASVFSQRKNFSTHEKACREKNGHCMNHLSLSSPLNTHSMAPAEHTDLRLGQGLGLGLGEGGEG